MKRSLSAFAAGFLIFSLWVSTLAQSPQKGPRVRQADASNQKNEQPAIVISSDRPLTNYSTQRNGEEYTVTISQVGNFETASNGQAFRQKQPTGTNDLVIAFRLQEGTNPQIFQKGNELRLFFSSRGTPPPSFLSETPINTQQQPGRSETVQVPGSSQSVSDTNRGAEILRTSTIVLTEPIQSIEPLSIESAAIQTADTCDKFNDEPRKDDPRDDLVVIDANTGKILEGAMRVHEHTRVKVAFVNKNPFKYDYNFQLIPKDVGNATVISFLGLIPGFSSIPGILPANVQRSVSNSQLNVDKTAALSTASARGVSTAPANANQCQDFATKLGEVVTNGEKIAKALKDANDLLKKASDTYAAFLKTTDTVPNGGTSQARIKAYKELCDAGTKTLTELNKVLDIDFDAFSKGLKLDLFSAQVAVLEDGLSSSGCDVVTQAVYKKAIGGLKTDVGTYKTRLDDLKKAVDDSQKKLEGPAKIIKAALGSSNSFAEAAYAPSLGDATSVSITIRRKNLRDENPKEEVVAVSQPIEIGEPRVVLSGGFGFSTINERTIIRQQSLVPGPTGALILGNRFGFENRSQFRPSGLLLLSGLITRFPLFSRRKDATFALSAGLVFSDRNSGLATEFVAGPSLGLANNKMFLTLGFHAARVEELGGGFKIGDPVPTDLTDPLPLQKNWLNGLIIALTFKFFQPK
jgi:hypothetical protein